MSQKMYVFKHGKVLGNFDYCRLKEFERLLGSFVGVVEHKEKESKYGEDASIRNSNSSYGII